MNNSAEIKKENKKALPKFILILLLAALVGGVSAILLQKMGSDGLKTAAVEFIRSFAAHVSPFGFIFAILVLNLPAIFNLCSVKKLLAGWDGENEDVSEKMDDKLNIGMSLLAISQILAFMNLSIVFGYMEYISNFLTAFALSTYFVQLLFSIVTQQKYIDTAKQLNPEKRGSLYDFNFQKKWLGSCDEAEQLLIGQAAFYAFNKTTTSCIIIWALLFFLDILFDTGILPMIVALLIFGISQISYMYKAAKLGHRKK